MPAVAQDLQPPDVFPPGPGADRLLLASHNRLLWYNYNTGKTDVLHEGEVWLMNAPEAKDM